MPAIQSLLGNTPTIATSMLVCPRCYLCLVYAPHANRYLINRSQPDPAHITNTTSIIHAYIARLVARADGGGTGGGVSGGVIVGKEVHHHSPLPFTAHHLSLGIVGGVIGAILIIGVIIYFVRRRGPLRGPIFPSATKAYPIATEQVYLPRYTTPTQPAYIHQSRITRPPPVVYPVRPSSAYYVSSQPARGVRFGEVGVRRI